MRPVSKKRQKEKKTYKKLFTQMDKDAKAKGEFVCFFCGKPIEGIASHHHLDGRENSMLNDPDNIILAHNDCHLAYHYKTMEQLKKESWFDAWLKRLREKSEKMYRKEMNKMYKSGLLFEEDE